MPTLPPLAVSRADVIRGPRRLLAVGAGLIAVGLALAGTVQRETGGLLLALGWGVLVFGIHAFGRNGSTSVTGRTTR